MPKRTRDPPPYPDDAFKRWRGNQYDYLSNRDGEWALVSISEKRTIEEDRQSEVCDKQVKKVFFADEGMGDNEDTDSESTPQARRKKRDHTKASTVDGEETRKRRTGSNGNEEGQTSTMARGLKRARSIDLDADQAAKRGKKATMFRKPVTVDTVMDDFSDESLSGRQPGEVWEANGVIHQVDSQGNRMKGTFPKDANPPSEVRALYFCDCCV
jgi:hypothetical protein